MEVEDTTKDTHGLYESHYRLKKLKCACSSVTRRSRTSQSMILRHALITAKDGNSGLLSVGRSLLIKVSRLPTTININGGIGLARKQALLVRSPTTLDDQQ